MAWHPAHGENRLPFSHGETRGPVTIREGVSAVFGEDADITVLKARVNSLSDQLEALAKKVQILEQNLAARDARMDEIYFAYGMPGFVEAKGHFAPEADKQKPRTPPPVAEAAETSEEPKAKRAKHV